MNVIFNSKNMDRRYFLTYYYLSLHHAGSETDTKAVHNHPGLRANEHEGVCYVSSRRGTSLVLFDGNTYTPNQKPMPGQASRNWKCSMYYKEKCRARVTTRQSGHTEFIRAAYAMHTHPKLFPEFAQTDLCRDEESFDVWN